MKLFFYKVYRGKKIHLEKAYEVQTKDGVWRNVYTNETRRCYYYDNILTENEVFLFIPVVNEKTIPQHDQIFLIYTLMLGGFYRLDRAATGVIEFEDYKVYNVNKLINLLRYDGFGYTESYKIGIEMIRASVKINS